MPTPNDVILYAADFLGQTYTSKILNGLRYRLVLDGTINLKPTTDYTISDISFTLLTAIISTDTTITMQFY